MWPAKKTKRVSHHHEASSWGETGDTSVQLSRLVWYLDLLFKAYCHSRVSSLTGSKVCTDVNSSRPLWSKTTCPATRGRSLHTESFCCTLTLTLLCFLEGKRKCECLVLRLPLKINATKCEVEKVLIMWGHLLPLMSWETKFRHVTLKGRWTNSLQVRWVNRIRLKLKKKKPSS